VSPGASKLILSLVALLNRRKDDDHRDTSHYYHSLPLQMMTTMMMVQCFSNHQTWRAPTWVLEPQTTTGGRRDEGVGRNTLILFCF